MEELQMQHLERSRVVSYFADMQRRASEQAAAAATSRDQLVAAQQQQIRDAADVTSAARDLRQSVEQVAQLAAEHMIMQRWAERFGVCKDDAIARFAACKNHSG